MRVRILLPKVRRTCLSCIFACCSRLEGLCASFLEEECWDFVHEEPSAAAEKGFCKDFLSIRGGRLDFSLEKGGYPDFSVERGFVRIARWKERGLSGFLVNKGYCPDFSLSCMGHLVCFY